MSESGKTIREWLNETYAGSSLTDVSAAELENIIKNAFENIKR